MALFIWLAIAVVLILLVLALTSRIRMRFRYSHSGADDQLIVVVNAWNGLVRYRLIVPSIMTQGRTLQYARKSSIRLAGITNLSPLRKQIGNRIFKRILKNRKTLQPLMKAVLRKVECTRFRLDLRVGTGDAPSTAVLSGALWSLYGCMIGAASQWIRLKARPYGAVSPVYDDKEFSVVWEADFRFRPIGVAAALLKPGNRGLQIRHLWQLWRQWRKGPQPV